MKREDRQSDEQPRTADVPTIREIIARVRQHIIDLSDDGKLIREAYPYPIPIVLEATFTYRGATASLWISGGQIVVGAHNHFEVVVSVNPRGPLEAVIVPDPERLDDVFEAVLYPADWAVDHPAGVS